MTIKICPKCNVEPRHGTSGYCKLCTKEYQKKWAAENNDKTRAYQAKYRADNLEHCREIDRANYWRHQEEYKVKHYENNKEKERERGRKYVEENKEKEKLRYKKYREENPEKVKESQRKYNDENPEKVKQMHADYRAKNPEKVILYSNTRRARKKQNGGKLSPDIIQRLFKLQKGKCACCKLPLGDNYHLDHIMPVKLGGRNEDSNMQLLRQRCNNQKSAKHPVDFMRERGYLL